MMSFLYLLTATNINSTKNYEQTSFIILYIWAGQNFNNKCKTLFLCFLYSFHVFLCFFPFVFCYFTGEPASDLAPFKTSNQITYTRHENLRDEPSSTSSTTKSRYSSNKEKQERAVGIIPTKRLSESCPTEHWLPGIIKKRFFFIYAHEG